MDSFADAASIRVAAGELQAFAARVLHAAGQSSDDAETTARVLLAADMRGIASHGVGLLKWYATMIEMRAIDATAQPVVVRRSAATTVLDARNGMGHPAGVHAMRQAIEMAAAHDVGIVTVRHSNHYGMAGYYAMMALEHDQIGVSLTNSPPLVVPTGGKQPALGTNPIAIAAPTEGIPAFVLDVATSVVPQGRLEVARRRGERLAAGWALDAEGRPTDSPEEGLAGGLLPLGGLAITSGYKGYGLAMAVEILSAVLPGSLYGPLIQRARGSRASDLGQFFMAVNIAAFDEPASFRRRLTDLILRVKGTARAESEVEILVAGEREHRTMERSLRDGVRLDLEVARGLVAVAKLYAIPLPFPAP